MKRLLAIFTMFVLVLTGVLSAPILVFSDVPSNDLKDPEQQLGPPPANDKDTSSDLNLENEIGSSEHSTKGSSQTRAVHYTPEDFPEGNVYYLISDSIDTVPSGRYLDGIPLKSDGSDTKLNKADLHLPNPNMNPPRTGYDDGNRMYFRFPRNPGQVFNANYNSSFPPPFINITFNTLETANKEINIEVYVDANGDFDMNNPDPAQVEGVIQYPMYSTKRPSPNWDVQVEETYEANGTWDVPAPNIPQQIRDGAIYLTLWRSDNLFDPEVPFLPDLLVYAGFTNKTSWLALPYEHKVTLPHVNASYDFIKDDTHKWLGIWEPPSQGIFYDEVPEWMKMKPYDTITFNASRSYDPNDDFNSNNNIDDGVPPGELVQADEVDTLQYKWTFGDGTNSGWQSSPMYNKKYDMDPDVRERNYTVKLQVRNRGQHIVEDSCLIRIFNEEHPPEIKSIDILPQSIDPDFGTYGPRAVVDQEVQFTAYAEDRDPWDLNDIRYEWDLDGDSVVDAKGRTVVTTYSSKGSKDITLWVYDGDPGNISTFSDSESTSLFISKNKKPVAQILAAKSGVAPVSEGVTVQYEETVTFNTSLCYDPDNLPGFDTSKPADYVQDHNLSFRWHWNKAREQQAIIDLLDPYADETIISPWTFNITTAHKFTFQDYIPGSNYQIQVYLEVDDGSAIVESEIFTVTINLKPEANFLINNRTEIQTPEGLFVGKQIYFDASPSIDPNDDLNNDGVITPPEVNSLTYAWEFDDGYSTTGKAVWHAFAKEGEHRIWLTVSDGELTGKKLRLVNVLGENNPPIPVVEIPLGEGPTHFPFSFKAGDSYDIDPNDYVVTWEWDFGDGSTSSERDTTHSYSKAGFYPITLTIWDNHKESTEWQNISIRVYNRDPYVVLNLLSTGFIDSPIKMSVTASDPDGEIIGYFWDFGDGTTLPESGEGWSNESSPDHIYTKEGTYTVLVRVQDDSGQTNVSSKPINIEEKDDTPSTNGDEKGFSQETLYFFIIGIIAAVIVIAIIIVFLRIRSQVF